MLATKKNVRAALKIYELASLVVWVSVYFLALVIWVFAISGGINSGRDVIQLTINVNSIGEGPTELILLLVCLPGVGMIFLRSLLRSVGWPRQ